MLPCAAANPERKKKRKQRGAWMEGRELGLRGRRLRALYGKQRNMGRMI